MNKHQYIFLSGLPRSGSTLLTSILSENPNIHTEGNSPLLQYMWSTHEMVKTKGREQLDACMKHEIANNIVKAIPDLYYANADRPVVMDKSRVWTWTPNINLIKTYITTNPKLIVLIRPIDQIIASFINVYHKNNRADYNINSFLVRGTDPIMKAYECMLMAMKENPQHCIFITYDYFINNPEATLNEIYKFCELEPFKHDLTKITNRYKENDVVYGLLGLHDVRENISKSSYKVELPEAVINHCKVLNKQMGLE